MIDPSSSEEEEEEEEDHEKPMVAATVSALEVTPNTNSLNRAARSISPASAVSADTLSVGGSTYGSTYGSVSRHNSIAGRPTSPSLSLASEKTVTEHDMQDKQDREEEERKKRLQLYVFVLRCISYPFNAKQPNDLTKRYQKVTKQQLEVIQGRFQNPTSYSTRVPLFDWPPAAQPPAE